MAKQTFTTGQVLTAAQMTSLQQTAMGGGEATAKTASYVLTAADAGTTVIMNAAGATTITVNTALFAAGDTVNIQNIGAGICTVTAGTATVNTAGSLALSQYEGGVLYFRSTSAATFFDYVQTGAVSPLTTKGDVWGYSTLDARIPVGANNTVLTADSAQALGVKWATVSAGGMTLLSTTTASGSSTSISVTSTGYNSLYVNIYGISSSSASEITMKLNSDATANYSSAWVGRDGAGSAVQSSSGGVAYFRLTGGQTCVASDTVNSTQINIYDPNNTSSFPKNINAYSTTFNSSGLRQFYSMMGSKISLGAITSIQIETTAGSWNNGTIQVYGVK